MPKLTSLMGALRLHCPIEDPLLGRTAQELGLVQECQVPVPTMCAVLAIEVVNPGGRRQDSVRSSLQMKKVIS